MNIIQVFLLYLIYVGCSTTCEGRDAWQLMRNV